MAIDTQQIRKKDVARVRDIETSTDEIRGLFETRFVHRGLGRWEPALLDAGFLQIVPTKIVHKFRDGFENRVGLIALRRMAAIVKR